VRFGDLRYRSEPWGCRVCEQSQPADSRLWLYHEGPVGTGDDSGYDCCIRCMMRGGWVKTAGSVEAGACEAGGIEAWLGKTGSCPICREKYEPPAVAPEPELRGPPPEAAKVPPFTIIPL
jgi:hypothetical protein